MDQKKLSLAHGMAQFNSEKGVVQHVNVDPESGDPHVSDWYHSDHTIATYHKGKQVSNEQELKSVLALVEHSLIDMVLSKNLTGAESAFKTVMAEKVASALASRKIEIAQSLYARAQG